jgi:hypothetical protein
MNKTGGNMSAGKSRGAKFFGGVLVGALCLVMAQTEAYSAQSSQPPQSKSTRQAPFTLTIENNLISLTARDASIKAILEEIGKRMNIAVVAAISPEETITTEFNRLSLKEALKELSENHAYVRDYTGRITNIVVTSDKKGVVRAPSVANNSIRDVASSKPEAFKFEFDPMR